MFAHKVQSVLITSHSDQCRVSNMRNTAIVLCIKFIMFIVFIMFNSVV
jgi:hypothetical protein